MGQDVQVLDHGVTPQVEQVLALPTVAGARPLPAPDVCQVMLDRNPFPQFRPPGRRQLALTQLLEQPLIAMNRHTASGRAGRAASRSGQTAHCSAGKCTTPPGSKGISTAFGQRMRCRCQSKAKTVLAKHAPERTGQALQ